ncbi:MAG: type II toxin-antitoxin system HicA family toxin [Candidatus Firestonebacteria bacterium]|nr:type II toxin-antitoxin system HicA family toxin [Candidatus Firestonebacteria bacterium]
MPKIPRELSGRDLIKILQKYGYRATRQAGSHIRLTGNFKNIEHHITIPDHDIVKIGTLNKIIKEVANYLEIDKQILIKTFFNS